MDDRVSAVRAAPADAPHDPALSELGSDIITDLDRARAGTDMTSRIRAKIAADMPSKFRIRKKKRTRLAAALGGLAVAAGVIVAVAIARRPDAPLARPTNTAEATPISFTVAGAATAKSSFISATKETPVKFSDGSELRLAPAARVRVTETGTNGARVLVESGSMHVSVVHREETRWAIEAGPYEVRVTGTKFVVGWDPTQDGLVVRMEEGSVVVKGCGQTDRRLGAGQELVVSCKEEKTGQAPTYEIDPPAKETKPKAADPSRKVVAHARAGENAEAIATAEASGYDATLAALSGPELLLVANAARYAGKFDHAVAALETARRRFADTDTAATAAFELGRIAMDVRHNYAAAADHFEVYLRERPNGALAREAMGRAIEARQSAGHDDRAAKLAARYLATWPDGPHATLARKLDRGGR